MGKKKSRYDILIDKENITDEENDELIAILEAKKWEDLTEEEANILYIAKQMKKQRSEKPSTKRTNSVESIIKREEFIIDNLKVTASDCPECVEDSIKYHEDIIHYLKEYQKEKQYDRQRRENC